MTIPLDKADFSDPDGDELTFAMSASRDDIYAAGSLTYNENIGRVFMQAKTVCALAELNPASGEVYETVVTVRYFASAAGNALTAADGTPLADFTFTVTTTSSSSTTTA